MESFLTKFIVFFQGIPKVIYAWNTEDAFFLANKFSEKNKCDWDIIRDTEENVLFENAPYYGFYQKINKTK